MLKANVLQPQLDKTLDLLASLFVKLFGFVLLAYKCKGCNYRFAIPYVIA